MSVTTHRANASAPGLSRLDRFALHWKAKVCLFLGLRGHASVVFHAVLARSPDDLLALNSLGYEAMQGGRHVLALTYFERVLALVPATSNAHFNVAFVCEELGRLEEAEREFRAAIRIEDKMDRAWYGLGLVLVRQGRVIAATFHPELTEDPRVHTLFAAAGGAHGG
jgi:tetratricopeptide (TPR) repeat protein